MSRKDHTPVIMMGLAAAAAASILLYMAYQQPNAKDSSSSHKSLDRGGAPSTTGTSTTATSSSSSESVNTDKASNTAAAKRVAQKNAQVDGKMDDKTLHAKIEEMDKKGKALFKNKQFLEAAKAFTDALEFIELHTDHTDITSNTSSASSSLNKQIITLINNRSAMYEKGKFPELALEDCNKILEVYDRAHTKARTRKLRILEDFDQNYNALVEVCALQLLYMQQNRETLRMGIQPASPPPVPQSKLEDFIVKLVPEQLALWEAKLEEKKKLADTLPSDYTLLQLLKSYTGYNSWMAKAARDGNMDKIDKELLDALPQDDNDDSPTAKADRASILLKKGRRHVYQGQYQDARLTLLKAFEMVDGKPDVYNLMKDDAYARLLEWTGMVKHWTYDLDGATACYQQCADLEPINAEVLVKQAGVAMDGGKHEDALALFEKALGIDPDTVDALLHRANLRMLQQKLPEAKDDLERCVQLRPDHVLAHLRLAAVLTSMNDESGAEKHLDSAERVDPESSEVQSYRGEVYFTQNEFAQAKAQFEKAIKLEPKNPTPYVNAALAELNTPPEPGQQMNMAKNACQYLEQAIEVDPQFHAAYVQLGQLKLGTATDLSAAKEVIILYEQALENCRTVDELKDLCSMKLLTHAQVDAATMLKMETFNMQ